MYQTSSRSPINLMVCLSFDQIQLFTIRNLKNVLHCEIRHISQKLMITLSHPKYHSKIFEVRFSKSILLVGEYPPSSRLKDGS